jgi:hypothetical protein
MGFHSLQHLRNRGSTSRGLCLPTSFRLQGLVTLLAAYSPRFRAGSVSHRQRSWDSPFGAFSSRKVSDPFPARKNPHTVSPVGIPAPKAQAGSTSRGSWVVALPGVPGGRHAFNTPTAGCSHGFCPSRGIHERLGKDFALPPLTRFSDPGCSPGRRRPRVSMGVRSALTFPAVNRRGRTRHPYGVSAPACILKHSGAEPIGLSCSPCIASHIAAD